jgi:hypothetical protein
MPEPDPDTAAEPFNWHPAVHASHFGETLYFFMIRLKEPLHRPVADQVRHLLHSAEIEYACEYSLFGWHDALIRVWLTPSYYRRLRRALDDSVHHNVDDYHHFTTTNIYYMWRDARDLLTEDQEVLADIAGASAEIASIAGNPDQADVDSWEKLRKLGLVFERPSINGGVKFYTVLDRISDANASQRQIDAILRSINETHMPTSDAFMSACATLYCGAGDLGDYLVRCVVDTYDDVLKLVESFDIRLKDARVRPMTLLIANAVPREFDDINDTMNLSLDDTTTADLLSVEPRTVARLDDHHRVELHHLAVTACELASSETALRKLLLSILHATAVNSHDDLYIALTYLVQFEPNFGKFVVTELPSVSREWFARIKRECEASSKPKWQRHAKEMTKQKERAWTLDTYKFTALAA